MKVQRIKKRLIPFKINHLVPMQFSCKPSLQQLYEQSLKLLPSPINEIKIYFIKLLNITCCRLTCSTLSTSMMS